MRERYPNRRRVPFAELSNCDDVARVDMADETFPPALDLCVAEFGSLSFLDEGSAPVKTGDCSVYRAFKYLSR